MFVKSIKLAKSAMFPIFRFEKLQKNQIKIGVVGTGFFINSKGIFVTVAHIFDSANKSTKFVYWGNLPDKIVNPNREIIEIVKDNNQDIFIGRIDVKSQSYLRFCKKIPEIGRTVCISGYPLAVISKNQQAGVELGGVRRYFQPTFVLDRAVIDSRSDTGVIRKHNGFLTRDFGLFGMSGGPVFDINGIVLGIQASVTNPRESKSTDGRTIRVENACIIRSGLVIDLLKRNKIRHPKTQN